MFSSPPRVETLDDSLDSELLFIERSMMMVTNESPKLSPHEKHISVDPISLKESSYAYPGLEFSPPKLLPKAKLVTVSLPNSATSSPRSNPKKKSKNIDLNQRQHSIALSRLAELKEKHHLTKSKSCGEGRSTSLSEDFDMWSPKKVDLPEFDDQPYEEQVMIELPKLDYTHRRHTETSFDDDDKVKCGALCLFLPLGKGKTVKPRKKTNSMKSVEKEMPYLISKRVSLEKFECGSWTSSAIILDNDDENEDSKKFFFELPLELIRNSNDASSPVKAAFVFDQKDLKGVLKKSPTSVRERKSCDQSARSVRFSASPVSEPTSPTTCITPRLRKAREDFNAFLQAQSA